VKEPSRILSTHYIAQSAGSLYFELPYHKLKTISPRYQNHVATSLDGLHFNFWLASIINRYVWRRCETLKKEK